MDSDERGMNPVAMTIINIGRAGQQPPVLQSATLPTEQCGSAGSNISKPKACKTVQTRLSTHA